MRKVGEDPLTLNNHIQAAGFVSSSLMRCRGIYQQRSKSCEYESCTFHVIFLLEGGDSREENKGIGTPFALESVSFA